MRRREYPTEWPAIAETVKELAGWRCACCRAPNDDNAAALHHLTIHHRDGNTLNCAPDNLMALCQPCYLRAQAALIKYGVPNEYQLPLPI